MLDVAATAPTDAEVDATFRKVTWRVIPLLLVCYVLAFVDRGNVGFAKLHFMADLHFSEAVYGFGGGLFYLGYSLLEVPSNLLLARSGVRLTLLRIMVLWGLCSAALALMSQPWHYYALRSLLGAAEAGFFPGVLFYLTTWIPASRRSRYTAYFMSAFAISGIVSGPMSGGILGGMEGVLGLKGWQWLFIAEGIPSALMGVVAYFTLADRPRSARWLTPRQVAIIDAELEAERQDKAGHSRDSFVSALRDRRLYVLLGMSVGLISAGGGIPLWLPTIIRQAGITNVWHIGLMAAVPYVVAVVVQQVVARHSDRMQERRWHAALPTFACAAGWLLLAVFNQNAWVSLAILTLMASGFLGATGPFWTMPVLYLSGSAAAGGIALITTAGGVGAFFAPTIAGWVTSQTGDLSYGLAFYGVIVALGAAILLLGTRPQPRPATADA